MVEVPAVNDDDDKFLYGENTEINLEKTNGAVPTVTDQPADVSPLNTSNPLPSQEAKKPEGTEGGGEEDEDGEFEESDDDDDDNIQVHIGEVTAATPGPYGTPVNWKKEPVPVATAAAAAKLAALPTQGQKKIDVNAVGLINGQPIYEYDLDTEQDEKPWRKPGADISDYFNYGFNEETWKQYCDKQRRMRMESQRSPYTVTQAVNPTGNAQVEIEVLPDGRTRVKAGPPPDRKVEGSIHVLGSSEDARRKQKEDELLALALNTTRVIPPGYPGHPGQRPVYTALPGGAVMYNPIPGQPMPPQMLAPAPPGGVPSSQPDGAPTDTPMNASEPSPSTSQPQQIQSLGGPPVIQYLAPGGQQIPGLQQIIPAGAPVFQPGPGGPMGMEFAPQDHFMQTGVMMPPMATQFNQFAQSDSENESDAGESRRHRSRRESKHSRRHRDRSDRDRSDRDRGDRDKDRDRERSSRRDRDRSDARRSHDHSKSSSDRKSKHSSRSSSSIKVEADEVERKPRISSRRSKAAAAAAASEASVETVEENNIKKEPVSSIIEVKQEPSGD